MATHRPTDEAADAAGPGQPGRLIARIGSASILRGHDGFLDITGDTPGARRAALAWMVTVNPSMVGRIRRCVK